MAQQTYCIPMPHLAAIREHADGDARPFAIPSGVAYEIVKALRGDRAGSPADTEGVPEPG
jgi:hypothetical protein